MKNGRKILPFIIFALAVVVLVVVIAALNRPIYSLPTEGTWYCDDFAIQICFDEDAPAEKTFVTFENQKVPCRLRYQQGASYLQLCCAERGVPGVSVGRVLFTGECFTFTEVELTMNSSDNHHMALFARID